MISRTQTWLLCLALTLAGACGTAPEGELANGVRDNEPELSVEERALEEGQDAYESAESPEEKIAIIRDFLEHFPTSKEVPDLLDTAVQHLLDDLHDAEAALDLTVEVLARMSDGDAIREVQLQLATLHGKAGRQGALAELSRNLEADYDLQYTDYLRLIEAAEDAEAWELSMEQAEASLDLATPAAFKVQWPDMSDQEAVVFGARRVSYSYAHKGWALAHLGQAEEALLLFESALPKTTYNVVGVDDTPLHSYWGRTLLFQGDFEAAMAKLVVEALHSPEPDAMESYREAWTAVHGSDEGLLDDLSQKRVEHARELPAFELPDYDGKILDIAQFKGDVMLVAAWFPT